jgi:hypothetical protein
MNVLQMHERLRLEMLRRIQRGTLSVSLLARQTGFGQPHLSNFLRGRRQLSLAAMDRILAAQRLAAGDLLPVLAHREPGPDAEEHGAVPLVTHAAALFERIIRPSTVQLTLHFPAAALASMRSRASASRRAWQRFVAVRVDAAEVQAMEPMVQPETIALIDRHYNTVAPYRPYRPNRPNVYAVRQGARLKVRYVEVELGRLVLRPHNLAFPVELIDTGQEDSLGDLLAGRVALVLNEL